jgi:hypothetical protein
LYPEFGSIPKGLDLAYECLEHEETLLKKQQKVLADHIK